MLFQFQILIIATMPSDDVDFCIMQRRFSIFELQVKSF